MFHSGQERLQRSRVEALNVRLVDAALLVPAVPDILVACALHVPVLELHECIRRGSAGATKRVTSSSRGVGQLECATADASPLLPATSSPHHAQAARQRAGAVLAAAAVKQDRVVARVDHDAESLQDLASVHLLAVGLHQEPPCARVLACSGGHATRANSKPTLLPLTARWWYAMPRSVT